MSNRRGGNLSRLSGYRLLVALLVCVNTIAAGLVTREMLQHTSGQSVKSTKVGQFAQCATAPALAAIKISAKHPGLTQLTSDPFYYDVDGMTSAEIKMQMAACRPFAADTSYVINWQVSYRSVASGQCRVDKVAVGLRTLYTYPRWNKPAEASASTAQSWSSFMQHLSIHEAGHVALDKQYARQIVQSLQQLQAATCQTLRVQVDATANHLVILLSRANTTYDTTTQHGATQGAAFE